MSKAPDIDRLTRDRRFIAELVREGETWLLPILRRLDDEVKQARNIDPATDLAQQILEDVA